MSKETYLPKARVLVVNTANTGFNGITSVIRNYTEHTYHKYDFIFVFNGNVDESVKDIIKSKYGPVYIPPVSRLKNPILYTLWLKSIIAKERISVIHVHGNSGTMFFDILAGWLGNVKIRIAHCHSTFCKFVFVHRLLKPALNILITKAAACSEVSGKWLFYGKYDVLNNGIDTSKFRFSEDTRQKYRKFLKLDNYKVIGHVGNFVDVKNHLFLIDVFYEVQKEQSDVKLLLIGDGVLREIIERRINQLGINDKVILLGKRSDVADLYQAMDFFVLPSKFEGFPVTLVEAQAAGLPCCVSDKVTKEVDITNTVKFISIENKKAIFQWAEYIKSFRYINDRNSNYDLVKGSIFDIESCCSKLDKLYGVNDVFK